MILLPPFLLLDLFPGPAKFLQCRNLATAVAAVICSSCSVIDGPGNRRTIDRYKLSGIQDFINDDIILRGGIIHLEAAISTLPQDHRGRQWALAWL